MPALITLLIAALGTSIGQFAFKVLLSIGVGYVSFTGFDSFIEQYHQQIIHDLFNLSGTTASLLGVLKVGTCISIIFSAITIRFSILGFNNGVLKKMKVDF